MTTEIVLTASVSARKTKKGYKARLAMHCNKFTTGARVYHSTIQHACDINGWAAMVIINTVSDIEGLNLHSAMQALHARPGSFKSVYIEMLRGTGYAFNSKCRPYRGTELYNVVSVQPLIKTRKEA